MSAPDDPRLLPYHYDLPDDLIARYPAARREDARLLRVGPPRAHQFVRDLPTLLRPGDLLVVNDTRVLAARVRARRATGGLVELLLLSEEGPVVEAMARPSRRLREGEVLAVLPAHGGEPIPGLAVRVERKPERGPVLVAPTPSAQVVIDAAGAMPLPPYLGRPAEEADRERYQTVFARQPGAVAAPTAGLHLTPDLFTQLEAGGVEIASVTLHVGAGTFRSLRSEDLDRGELHREEYVVPEETAASIERCRRRGGRVVAVGTTSTRTLESAAQPGGLVRAGRSATRLFIRPGYRFGVVDALLTNFHLPASSLMMLVCAFGGRDRVMSAYGEAVARRYRFFSYGDAMLIEAER